MATSQPTPMTDARHAWISTVPGISRDKLIATANAGVEAFSANWDAIQDKGVNLAANQGVSKGLTSTVFKSAVHNKGVALNEAEAASNSS